MERGFGGYHPTVNFIFFGGAVVFGMFFIHPAFLTLSVVFSSAYYFLLKGKKGLRFFGEIFVLVAVIALLNPVFNQEGQTVLFFCLDGRVYTLEALLYGIATAMMFLSVLLWFACYNEVMSSDKFLYLFGRKAPTLSLVFCMVLRFVPHFRQKVGEIRSARSCIGKFGSGRSRKEKLGCGMAVLSALASWALENAAMTADAMKSRGYGSGEKTMYFFYRMTARDRIFTAFLVLLMAIICVCVSFGGTQTVYLPNVEFSMRGTATIVGLVCYGMFLAVPTVVVIWEEITWYILQSKI
ncbi:MAG: energy-coupling factor transporter transmembrane component T [Christensenella sp.]|nr:energy-coupling factor transporter transmembrane component T [Christensenella sp.]